MGRATWHLRGALCSFKLLYNSTKDDLPFHQQVLNLSAMHFQIQICLRYLSKLFNSFTSRWWPFWVHNRENS